MTVPPNYSVPPEHPPPPAGYGYGYGGPPPPEASGGRTWLLGGIVVACTTLVLGSILLAAFLVNRDEEATDSAAVDEDTAPSSEESASPDEDPTTEAVTTEVADEFTGQCLPYSPQVSGTTVDTSTSCDEPEAFWTITAWTDDIEATVDEEANLTDNQPAYDVCGPEYGRYDLGELWTDWYYVYDQATLEVDYLYCIEAIGNPDDKGRTPYMPDTGECFDDSSEWWTVPCDSDLAVYEVVDTVEFEDPRVLSEQEASDEATCGGEYYWEVTDLEDRTTAILCGNER